MQNYWPIAGSTIDVIGQMNMEIKLNGQLTTDRFGNPESALLLSEGYASVPSGIYFDPTTGGFTFMAWIKIIKFTRYARIFEFGNVPNADNVLIYFDHDEKKIYLQTYIGATLSKTLFSTNVFNENEWYHVAVSVSGGTATLYQNGVEQGVMNGNILVFKNGLSLKFLN